MQVKAGAQRNIAMGKIELLIWAVDRLEQKLWVIKNVDFSEVKEGESATATPWGIMLQKEDAQSLIDDLWAAGMRPSHNQESSEILSAKNAHIKDLQSVNERLFSWIEKMSIDNATPDN